MLTCYQYYLDTYPKSGVNVTSLTRSIYLHCPFNTLNNKKADTVRQHIKLKLSYCRFCFIQTMDDTSFDKKPSQMFDILNKLDIYINVKTLKYIMLNVK